MALKEVANEDCTLDFKEVAITTGTITITSAASTKVKAEGKGVYAGGISFTISGAATAT